MTFRIRRAELSDFEEVISFYDRVIDDQKVLPYGPGWTKNVYPDHAMLKDKIASGAMFLGTDENEIISAMAVDSHVSEGYDLVPWSIPVQPGEAYEIHILAVRKEYGGRGIGRQMCSFAAEYAKSHGGRALHLDIVKGNLWAQKLYEKFGFRCVGEAELYYEDTGWHVFVMYEYPL